MRKGSRFPDFLFGGTAEENLLKGGHKERKNFRSPIPYQIPLVSPFSKGGEGEIPLLL